ncbi:MAG TPA: MBL fold metallo-hydrolase [Candidatus Angelobacter sp.]|nr:MBL fold metallo-hydrolase [Candidatus Angelobacter sp.]
MHISSPSTPSGYNRVNMWNNLCVVVGASLVFTMGVAMSGQPKPEWCRNLPRPAYKSLEQVTQPDDWFEVYRIRPGVFAIYEPHQSEEVISYLIVGRQRALMFDTGLGISDIKQVVQRLTSFPVSVLNSHTHNDHVSGNWQFTDIYGMDTDFTRKNAQGSRDDAQAEIAPGELCGPLPAGFDAKNYSTKPFTITHWLHDGDGIDLGGRKLIVVATPGHTPDAISLLDEANGLLFTGDTYYPGTIWLYRPETDLGAYEKSLERMIALAPKVRLLLPAHNVPVAEPTKLPKLLHAFRQVRSGKVKPEQQGEKRIYKAEGFSFLMK